jgi:hypothetical protein
MRVIPASWRRKIHRNHFVEVVILLVGLFSGAFGTVVIVYADQLRGIVSFQQAFQFAQPNAWGIGMIVLSVAMMVALLAPRRVWSAIPTYILAGVWFLWAVPIMAVPGFTPTAPIIYGFAAVVTLASAFFCMFERET